MVSGCVATKVAMAMALAWSSPCRARFRLGTRSRGWYTDLVLNEVGQRFRGPQYNNRGAYREGRRPAEGVALVWRRSEPIADPRADAAGVRRSRVPPGPSRRRHRQRRAKRRRPALRAARCWKTPRPGSRTPRLRARQPESLTDWGRGRRGFSIQLREVVHVADKVDPLSRAARRDQIPQLVGPVRILAAGDHQPMGQRSVANSSITLMDPQPKPCAVPTRRLEEVRDGKRLGGDRPDGTGAGARGITRTRSRAPVWPRPDRQRSARSRSGARRTKTGSRLASRRLAWPEQGGRRSALV